MNKLEKIAKLRNMTKAKGASEAEEETAQKMIGKLLMESPELSIVAGQPKEQKVNAQQHPFYGTSSSANWQQPGYGFGDQQPGSGFYQSQQAYQEWVYQQARQQQNAQAAWEQMIRRQEELKRESLRKREEQEQLKRAKERIMKTASQINKENEEKAKAVNEKLQKIQEDAEQVNAERTFWRWFKAG